MAKSGVVGLAVVALCAGAVYKRYLKMSPGGLVRLGLSPFFKLGLGMRARLQYHHRHSFSHSARF